MSMRELLIEQEAEFKTAMNKDVVAVTAFFKNLRKGVVDKKEINKMNLFAIFGIGYDYCCTSEEIKKESDKILKRRHKKNKRNREQTDCPA